MKKAVIVLASASLLIFLLLAGQLVHKAISDTRIVDADKTANVNVMLTRPEGWKDIGAKPVITINEMTAIDGSTATIPITAEILRQFFKQSDDSINRSQYIKHTMTHSAYLRLMNKERSGNSFLFSTIDIIFVTQPSQEELHLAESKNVKLDITPIAKDGFVFITHKDNPVDSLTIEQVQKIYRGEITNWKQVGGKDKPIVAYQREPNSGSQTAMEQLVMQGTKLIKPIDTKVLVGMGRLVDAVAEYQNGPASIGYTYYYYINNLYKNANIKVLKINGVSPDDQNLIDGSYPFTTSYYAVLREGQPADSPAVKLRDFLITPKGQELIEMAGYCRGASGNE